MGGLKGREEEERILRFGEVQGFVGPGSGGARVCISSMSGSLQVSRKSVERGERRKKRERKDLGHGMLTEQ